MLTKYYQLARVLAILYFRATYYYSIRLCEERNLNLSTKIDFYTLLNVYFYRLHLFVSVVYKLSVPYSHRLLVIEAADGVWMLVSSPV